MFQFLLSVSSTSKSGRGKGKKKKSRLLQLQDSDNENETNDSIEYRSVCLQLCVISLWFNNLFAKKKVVVDDFKRNLCDKHKTLV